MSREDYLMRSAVVKRLAWYPLRRALSLVDQIDSMLKVV
jgi:hypothetical protein